MMSSDSKGGIAERRLEPVESERTELLKSEAMLSYRIGSFLRPNRSLVVLFMHKLRTWIIMSIPTNIPTTVKQMPSTIEAV